MDQSSKKGKKARITCSRTTPYRVEGIVTFRDSEGRELRLKPVMHLCRCGQSGDKPFCDGAHANSNFRAEKDPDRIRNKVLSYKGDHITIHDNRGVCSHNMACIDELPRVFDMSKKRWIDPDAAEAGEIIEVIHMCPSGSLSYTRDGETYTGLDRKPGIVVDTFGPLEVVGGVELEDDMGSTPQAAEHYTLCRCGRTRNAPFCDGAHFHEDTD
jgi:CDGSH-type Zn-finger protein